MDLKEIINGFSSVRIGVIGDLVADEYIFGYTSRISREAPVLILKFDYQDVFLGGAASTINNVRSLGAKVESIGVVGMDPMGDKILDLLKEKEMDTSSILRVSDRFTTTKTRILAGGLNTTRQQVIRIDKEENKDLSHNIDSTINERCEQLCSRCDALIISDYGLGVVSESLIETINRLAREKKHIISVDSRWNIKKFRGITSITPNEPEVEAALGVTLKCREDVINAGRKLIEETGDQNVLITRGREGMMLFGRDGAKEEFNVFGGDEVSDVTGAGDTVVSVFTLALAVGADASSAARLSNIAAGMVVQKRGTATISRGELLSVIEKWELGNSNQ